jgi:hypothetical protein
MVKGGCSTLLYDRTLRCWRRGAQLRTCFDIKSAAPHPVLCFQLFSGNAVHYYNAVQSEFK